MPNFTYRSVEYMGPPHTQPPVCTPLSKHTYSFRVSQPCAECFPIQTHPTLWLSFVILASVLFLTVYFLHFCEWQSIPVSLFLILFSVSSLAPARRITLHFRSTNSTHKRYNSNAKNIYQNISSLTHIPVMRPFEAIN